MSKVLANRLKRVMGLVILDKQAAFLPSIAMNDNVMLVHKILHSMKNKYRGRIRYAAMKIDMSKAYDRIEWGFDP